MKAVLLTATAASALLAATFGAQSQTTITTTTTQSAPQVVFTPEQTTVIRRTFVEAPQPEPIVIDEDLIVGGIIPGSVPLQPVPSTIVTEIPNVQNYHYAVVGNEVVFVEPSTRRVVAVINQ